MQTGKFDLNKLHVEIIIFESAKKNLRIQKYPNMCGRGLSNDHGNGNENVKKKKAIGFICQKNDSPRAAHFFVHFFAVT